MECSCGAFLRSEHRLCPQCGRTVNPGPRRSSVPTTALATLQEQSNREQGGRVRTLSELPFAAAFVHPATQVNEPETRRPEGKPRGKARRTATASPDQHPGNDPGNVPDRLRIALVPHGHADNKTNATPASYQFKLVRIWRNGRTDPVLTSKRFPLPDASKPTPGAIEQLDRLRHHATRHSLASLPREGGHSWYATRFATRKVADETPEQKILPRPKTVDRRAGATTNRVHQHPNKWVIQLPKTPRPDAGSSLRLPPRIAEVVVELEFRGRRINADHWIGGELDKVKLIAVAVCDLGQKKDVFESGTFKLKNVRTPNETALARLAELRQLAINARLEERYPEPDDYWFSFTYEARSIR